MVAQWVKNHLQYRGDARDGEDPWEGTVYLSIPATESTDRGTHWATIHGVSQSQVTEHACTHF